jgi:hypothetical protein
VAKRKCRHCRQPFTPANSLQVACSLPCALELAPGIAEKKRKAVEAEKRKAHRAARQKLKTRQDWLREAQQAFNAWVRERDHGMPCISCGTTTAGQWHAGHYRTTKAAPELRFEPLNCHKQCAQCNNFDSGNIVEYRLSLINRIGADKVDWLEGPHEAKKYTIDDLREIRDYYRALARELKNART